MASTPEQVTPAAASTAPGKKRVSRTTDIVLSIVFLCVQMGFVFVLYIVLYILYGLTGSSGTFASDAGEIIAQFGPGVIFIANVVVGLVLMLTKRTSWIATMVGLLASGLVFWLGFALSYLSND